MSSSPRNIAGLLLFIVLATVAAVYGWGAQYYELITARSNNLLLDGVDGDRWMRNGAELHLPYLAGRGNVLTVSFNEWHPANQPPPRVSVSVCNRVVSSFVVHSEHEFPVYLRGTCQPRTVRFEFDHVFPASDTDVRQVGAQVMSFVVSSRFGIPLVQPWLIIVTVLGFISLALIVGTLASGLTRWALLLVVLAGGTFLLSRSTFFAFEKILTAWGTLLVISVGAHYASVQPQKERKFEAPVTALLLVLILALAVALRTTGLSFGLPAIYHPDEYQKYLAVNRMRSYGDLNPRYFLHPSVLLYATYGMNVVVQALSDWPTWEDSLIFAGRIVSCLAGSLSVLLVFFIARGLCGAGAGLISAAFLAVFPLHVTCSRYVKEDALLTFFILCAVLLVVVAVRRNQVRWLLLAGICTGLAAGVKYSGLISFFVLWGYPWLRRQSFWPERSAVGWCFLATLLLPIGFILSTPYSVLDYATFLEDFNSEREHMIEGHSSAITAASQFWLFHLRQSILPGIGLPAVLVALAMVGVCLRRFRFPGLYLVALTLLFYLPAEYVRAKPAPQPERYILPCLPFVACLLGYCWMHLSRQRMAGRVLSCILVIAWLLPATRALQLASEVPVDTRDRMQAWLADTMPSDARVLVDWRQYGPQFSDPGFEVEYMHPTEIILRLHKDSLANSGADYLILSSLHYSRYFTQPNIVPAYREVIRRVFRDYPVVHQEFSYFGQYGFHNPDLTVFDLRQGVRAGKRDDTYFEPRGDYFPLFARSIKWRTE